MRPIRLCISAFGPYAGKTCIEMNRLGKNGLYLITGDTGSGKTTIFDAITYALFGEASGANREPNMLRSKYADPETPTQVELTFAYSGKEFTIRRNPDYERPSKRGDKTTMQKADAELVMPDGQIISKIKDCNEAIRNILGIDRNQFSQIAMIAQGDFLKLLLASTEDRKKIFRQIFKTGLFQSLQDLLKNETNSLTRERETLRNSVRQYIDGILCDENDVLSLELQKAKDNPEKTSELLSVLDLLITGDQSKKVTLGDKRKVLEESLSKRIERIGKAAEIKKTRCSLAIAQDQIPMAEKSLSITKAELDREVSRCCERDLLSEQITTINNTLPQYDDLEGKRTTYLQNQLEIEKQRILLNEQEEDLKELSELLKNQRNEAELLKNAGSEVEAISAKIQVTKEKIKQLTEISKINVDYQADLEKHLLLNQRYTDANESVNKQRSTYLRLNRLFLDEQAGILSLDLVDGLPCPVCGSTTHPAPASKSLHAPTEAELERVKLVLEQEEANERTISRQIGTLNGMIQTRKEELIRRVTDLADNISMDHLSEEISISLQRANKDLEDRTKEHQKAISDNTRKELLLDLIVKSEKSQEQLRDFVFHSSQLLTVLETKLKESEKTLNEASDKLLFPDKKSAAEKIHQLSQKKTELLKQLEQATLRFEEAKSFLLNLQGQVDSLSKSSNAAEDINETAESEEKQKIEIEKTRCEDAISSVEIRLNSNLRAKSNIEKQEKELMAVETKWSWVKALSDTANGTLSGKEKIMLETYIQMTYFDRIVARANSRFMKMSGGQYELKRSVEAENNQKQSGLDLSVIDHYNGSERSVKTLSGGESFKASLSLALGLSDEIQSCAGGIRLDTMFVDEGFGSLDEESLKQAINTLSGLTEGNRLVGIISHVSELKMKIDKQLVVNKDKSGGSHVVIVV